MKRHLQCRTQEEIGEAVGMTRTGIESVLTEIANLQKTSNPSELDPKLGVPWLKAECGFSHDSARRWMRIYQDREKLRIMRNLTPTDAYKLLASPGVVTEAERKMGQMLKETERAKGMRAIGGDKRSGGTVTLPPEDAPTLSALGLSKRESAEAQMLAELPHSSRYDAVEAIPLPDAYRQTIFDLRCAYGHVRAKKGHRGEAAHPRHVADFYEKRLGRGTRTTVLCV